MKKILILFFLLYCKHSYSQIFNYAWHHHMGGIGYQNYLKMILMDNDDLILMGNYESSADVDPAFYNNYFLFSSHGKTFFQRITPKGELLWVVQFDSSAALSIYDMNRDVAGDIYICGGFQGAADMDPSSDTLILHSIGFGGNSYFAKYSGQDGHLIWAHSFATAGDIRGICADASGNVFLTGNFPSTFDFDHGPGVFTLPIPSTSSTGCIAQYDMQGNFVNAIYYGIQYFQTIALDIQVDSHDRVYFFGSFESIIDFDAGPDTFNLTGSQHDGFLIKLSNSLQFLDGVAFVGTSGFSTGKMLIDHDGSILIGGEVTDGTIDFDGSANTAILTLPGTADVYMTRQDSMLNYLSAWQITGNGNIVRNFVTDSGGNVYMLFEFSGSIDVDPDTAVVNLTGSSDIGISKYSSSGQYLWSTQLGTGAYDLPKAICVTASNKLIFTANLYAYLDLDPGPDTVLINVVSSQDPDAYIAAYNLCNPPVTNLSPVICKGQSFTVGSQSFTETGNFSVHLTSASGCDSIVNVDLTVVSPFTKVCTDSRTLICHTDSASFQWINCSTSAIVGTDSSFQAPNNDEYAVVVTQNGCVDTSNCIQVYQRANDQQPEFAWGNVLPSYGDAMQVSNAGNIYIAGSVDDSSNFELLGGTGHYFSRPGQPRTVCIIKYDENRNFIWGKEFGWPVWVSNSLPEIGSMILDDDENLYVLGRYTDSIEVDPGPGSVYLGKGGYNYAAFLLKFNSSGQLLWADQLPYQSTSLRIETMFLDDSGHVYLGGKIDGFLKIHPTAGDSDLFMSGTYADFMLIQFAASNGQPIWHYIASGPVNEEASLNGGTVDHDGNLLVAGYFEYPIDFDPGPGTTMLSPWQAGSPDGFIAKYTPSMQLIWVKKVNGYTGRAKFSVVADCNNSVYMSGPAPFLYKYDSAGTFKKAFPVSGNGLYPESLDIDELNNIYAYYELGDQDGIIGTDTFICTSTQAAVHDIVIAKFRSDGYYDWGMQIASDGDDRPGCFQTGKNGDIFFTGYAGDTLDADISSNISNLNTWYFNYPNFLIKYGQTCAAVDTSVTGDSLNLSAVDTNSYYQWIDCSSGAVIPGANSSTLPSTVYGYVRLIVYQGDCSDTSGCHFSASTVNIQERGHDIIGAFPNPASDNITISFTPLSQQSRITVINSEGKEMLREEIMSGAESYQIPTDVFPPGLYTVVLTEEGSTSAVRFIVDK